jgi:hypothetical protein
MEGFLKYGLVSMRVTLSRIILKDAVRFPGRGYDPMDESVFCGSLDEVIPLPHDPVEACGKEPDCCFTMKQASRKAGSLNHFIYGLSMILRMIIHKILNLTFS